MTEKAGKAAGAMRRFGVSSAAVLAEPTIAEIKKVVCLIHGLQDQRSPDLRSENLTSDL